MAEAAPPGRVQTHLEREGWLQPEEIIIPQTYDEVGAVPGIPPQLVNFGFKLSVYVFDEFQRPNNVDMHRVEDHPEYFRQRGDNTKTWRAIDWQFYRELRRVFPDMLPEVPDYHDTETRGLGPAERYQARQQPWEYANHFFARYDRWVVGHHFFPGPTAVGGDAWRQPLASLPWIQANDGQSWQRTYQQLLTYFYNYNDPTFNDTREVCPYITRVFGRDRNDAETQREPNTATIAYGLVPIRSRIWSAADVAAWHSEIATFTSVFPSYDDDSIAYRQYPESFGSNKLAVVSSIRCNLDVHIGLFGQKWPLHIAKKVAAVMILWEEFIDQLMWDQGRRGFKSMATQEEYNGIHCQLQINRAIKLVYDRNAQNAAEQRALLYATPSPYILYYKGAANENDYITAPGNAEGDGGVMHRINLGTYTVGVAFSTLVDVLRRVGLHPRTLTEGVTAQIQNRPRRELLEQRAYWWRPIAGNAGDNLPANDQREWNSLTSQADYQRMRASKETRFIIFGAFAHKIDLRASSAASEGGLRQMQLPCRPSLDGCDKHTMNHDGRIAGNSDPNTGNYLPYRNFLSLGGWSLRELGSKSAKFDHIMTHPSTSDWDGFLECIHPRTTECGVTYGKQYKVDFSAIDKLKDTPGNNDANELEFVEYDRSIVFKQHPATINPQEITRWVTFLHKLFFFAAETPAAILKTKLTEGPQGLPFVFATLGSRYLRWMFRHELNIPDEPCPIEGVPDNVEWLAGRPMLRGFFQHHIEFEPCL